MPPEGSSPDPASGIPRILVRAATNEPNIGPSEAFAGTDPNFSMANGNEASVQGSVSLENQLWRVAVKHAIPPTKSFWPPPLWEALVTEKSIVAELVELDDNIDQETAIALARNILGRRSGRHISVFTILLLLDKLSNLKHMQQCEQGGLLDHDLPLVLKAINGAEQALFHRHGRQVRDCCLHKWKRVHLEGFNELQRRLSPPVFGLKEGDNTVVHLDLHDDDILPWCEFQDNLIPVPAMSGGYGTVSKVKIHPMCHKFDKTLRAINVAGGLFAVKRLKQKNDPEFLREVQALSRFSGKVHKHLVTLLATFNQGGHYHMIFPWAEYDLDAYWDFHPKPDLADHGLVRWVSKQCLGIMEAISLVHDPQHLTSDKKYGRHGDIKAENILWYKTANSHDRGILVISDFGLAAMNSEKSRSMLPNDYVGLKMTPSYRPPECDTLDGKITRAFDIWTLGCLFLELACWLLKGTEGKLAFDTARTTPFILGANVDIFFDIKRSRDDETKHVFMVKEVVSRTMGELHDEHNCTAWVHALLDLIEQDMLLVLSSKQQRKNSKYLSRKLREMDQKASSSKSYCTAKAPQKRLSRWTKPPGVLSELSEAAQKHVAEVQPKMDVYSSSGASLHRSLRPSEWDRLER